MAHPTFAPEHDRALFMQGHMPLSGYHQPQSGYPPIIPPTPPTFVMNQFPSKFVGYLLEPIPIPGGTPSWEHFTEKKMAESDAKIAEIVKKDPAQNKPEEALGSKNLSDTKRQHIQYILNRQKSSESAPDMTWKLVSVKLAQEKVISKSTKGKVAKNITKSIRIILKRVSRTTPAAFEPLSMSFPATAGLSHGQHGTPMVAFTTPHLPSHTPPIIHQNNTHHGGHGVDALFGEQGHSLPAHHHERQLPPEMVKLNSGPEVTDDYPDEGHDDAKHHKSGKKDDKGKKDKQKAKPIEIYIPTIHDRERHNSKNSSRPTSWYESDGYSVLDSPITSASGSLGTGGWYEAKHSAKHYRKYRKGRGHDNLHRMSLGNHSNDSFVVIPNQTHRSGHKHKNSSSSLDKTGLDSSKDRRDLPSREDQTLAGIMDKLNLEIDKRIQDREKEKHNQEVVDRLHRIETILHNGGRERERPVYEYATREIVPRERAPYDRSYSENYQIGYSGGRRRNTSGYRY